MVQRYKFESKSQHGFKASYHKYFLYLDARWYMDKELFDIKRCKCALRTNAGRYAVLTVSGSFHPCSPKTNLTKWRTEPCARYLSTSTRANRILPRRWMHWTQFFSPPACIIWMSRTGVCLMTPTVSTSCKCVSSWKR